MFRPLLLISLCLITSITQASDDLYTKEYQQCIDKADGVTIKIIECANEEYDLQDKRLNVAYQIVMANSSTIQKDKLKKAQRLWIQYRDANCAFYNDPEGGSLARIMANDCMVEETAERAKELEDMSQL